jgi:hypothetical protein
MPWDNEDAELWRRAKLVRGFVAVREAVRRAEITIRAPEGSAPSLMLAENEAFMLALRAELERLLTGSMRGTSYSNAIL